MLPPTDTALEEPQTRPYFLWWTDTTVAELRAHLACEDRKVRAYWLGALLREANSRDVWLFTTPEQIGERRMLDRFDRRVIPDSVLDLVRFVQQREDCHLAGGAALSGAHLAHRLSADIDLFVHEAAAHRRVCRLVQDAVLHAGGTSVVVQDGGSL